MNAEHVKWLVFAAIVLPLAACGDPLKWAQDLESSRVIGARASGAQDNASLHLGEEATFEILLASENGPTETRIAYQICEAVDSASGTPYCASEPFSEGELLGEDPRIQLQLPEDMQAGARLALLGVACVVGEPVLSEDPLDWSCSEGSEPLRFSFDAWTASAEERVNQNPSLAEAAVTFSSQRAIFEDIDVEAACADGVPVLEAGQLHSVEIFLGESAREPFEDEFVEGGMNVENLQISHFATAGRFERQYSLIEGADTPQANLTWEAPEEPGPVKAYAVVRDGLGGVSWMSFSVCVE